MLSRRGTLLSAASTLAMQVGFAGHTLRSQPLFRFGTGERVLGLLGAIESALSLVDRVVASLSQRGGQRLCLLPVTETRVLAFRIQILVSMIGGNLPPRGPSGGALEAIDDFLSRRADDTWLTMRRMLAAVVLSSDAVLRDIIRIAPLLLGAGEATTQQALPQLAAAAQQLHLLVDEILLEGHFPTSEADIRFLYQISQRLRTLRERALASDLALLRLHEARQAVSCG